MCHVALVPVRDFSKILLNDLVHLLVRPPKAIKHNFEAHFINSCAAIKSSVKRVLAIRIIYCCKCVTSWEWVDIE